LRRLINIGVYAEMPVMAARKTRIVNLSSMVAGILLCLFVVVMLVRNLWANAIFYSFFAFASFITLYINSTYRHTLARLYSLSVIAIILICMEFLMRGESKYIFVVCLMLLGMFLAESRKESVAIFIATILIYLIHFFSPTLIDVEAIPNETTVGRWINLTVGSVTLVLIVELFKADGNKYEELISKSNRQLEVKRSEAEAQREITQRQAQKLTSKNAEAITMNLDIQDSIRYARRIQTSMLLTKEQLRVRFPDSLLFYKPKDVLSGDFYWFSEKDGYLFVAVADCTGHGVPGAMMTVMGNNLLQQIVTRDNILSPAAILTELDKRIIELLGKRSHKGDQVNDGMDMALIRVDRGSDNLMFASAKRPLYAFHGTSGDLTEYSASRLSIGGHMYTEKAFTEQEIAFRSNDMFYLLTDGYADQLGPQGKFMAKRLRRLLQDIHRKPHAEQHRILNETLLRWKVAEPQTDDILVFGLRL
jgi:serine phosphatase RsbU (regulator of sigma subunit)